MWANYTYNLKYKWEKMYVNKWFSGECASIGRVHDIFTILGT